MDIERGNIEIVFQKIPYMYVIKKPQGDGGLLLL